MKITSSSFPIILKSMNNHIRYFNIGNRNHQNYPIDKNYFKNQLTKDTISFTAHKSKDTKETSPEQIENSLRKLVDTGREGMLINDILKELGISRNEYCKAKLQNPEIQTLITQLNEGAKATQYSKREIQEQIAQLIKFCNKCIQEGRKLTHAEIAKENGLKTHTLNTRLEMSEELRGLIKQIEKRKRDNSKNEDKITKLKTWLELQKKSQKNVTKGDIIQALGITEGTASNLIAKEGLAGYINLYPSSSNSSEIADRGSECIISLCDTFRDLLKKIFLDDKSSSIPTEIRKTSDKNGNTILMCGTNFQKASAKKINIESEVGEGLNSKKEIIRIELFD